MTWALSLAVVFAAAGLFTLVMRFVRSSRRTDAVRLPEGTLLLRQARDVPVRVFVDRDVEGGPVARGTNRAEGHMVLSDRGFVLATWHGRVLEVPAGNGGSARCVGPRLLVVEGDHPGGRARVRAEIIVDDAEGWAAAIATRPLSTPPPGQVAR